MAASNAVAFAARTSIGTAYRFAEQPHDQRSKSGHRTAWPASRSRAKTTCKSHFRRGNRQAAFAQIVTGSDQAGMDRAVHGSEGSLCCLRIELGDLAIMDPVASDGG